MTAHQLGQSTQKGQQVKASRDSVRASRRDTQASLKPTAKGSESTNSSSSQLLSCAHHSFHLGSERGCKIHSLPGTEGTRVTKACRSCSMACIRQTVMQQSANPCGWCMHAHLSQTGHPLRDAGCKYVRSSGVPTARMCSHGRPSSTLHHCQIWTTAPNPA